GVESGVEWQPARQGITVKEGKMFAPGNLRAVADRADYLELVRWWMEQGYTLRYSGGMVPDINQILLKGKGIFSYPGYSEAPQGKLRLLFECAPMAYLLEQAGGAGSDGTMPILDKTIESIHQRTPVYLGSKEEVKRCEERLGRHGAF
ncbi:MAG: fructose-bisphosphatase class I, partial [Candidatus Gracilibacteria bacterium]